MDPKANSSVDFPDMNYNLSSFPDSFDSDFDSDFDSVLRNLDNNLAALGHDMDKASVQHPPPVEGQIQDHLARCTSHCLVGSAARS